MSDPIIDSTIDMSNPKLNAEFRSAVAATRGLVHWVGTPVRPTRSNRANAYMWAAIITPLMHFLNAQNERKLDKDQTFLLLKKMVLGEQTVHVGRILETVPYRTSKMDSHTFWDFIDRSRIMLRNDIGLDTLDPGEYGVAMPDPVPVPNDDDARILPGTSWHDED